MTIFEVTITDNGCDQVYLVAAKSKKKAEKKCKVDYYKHVPETNCISVVLKEVDLKEPYSIPC